MASLPAVDAADVSSIYAKAAALIDAAARGEDVDMSEARLLLQKAAAAGWPAAVGRLGRWHLFGLYGVARDLRQALILLHAAATAGDTDSCYWLGHALGKMDEFVQQERVLQAALQASASSSSQVITVPPVANPDPTRDESEAEAASRVSAAQEVILAIRAMRKANAVAKAQGKKGAAGAGQEGKGTVTALAGGSFDPVTLPLKSHPSLAYSWLVLAARGEHADAMVSLGNLCMAWEGQGAGPERTKEAVQWYELAARLPSKEEGATPAPAPSPGGHPDAQYNLGMCYWDGVPGVVDRDRERALLAFTTAAEQGDASARMFLGHAYRTGPPGVRVNRGKALRYLELASADGHGGAAHYLAQLWRDGDGSIGLKADVGKALYFLGLACDADVPEAWAERGDVLLHGGWPQEGDGEGEGTQGKQAVLQAPGLTVDLPGALYAYERAGSLGHAAALVSAGAMHYQGLGTPANAQLAGERYRAAGELGNPQGWDNLAALHAKGEGVPQSLQAARTYRDLAARIRKLGDGQGEEGQAQGDCEGSVQYSPAQGGGGGCGKSTCGCK